MTKISYKKSEGLWPLFRNHIDNLIYKNSIKNVCEIGGGANPLLDLDYIYKKGINYSVMDISETELNKAPRGYNRIIADIAAKDFSIKNKFDLVFSKMLAEHIKNPKQFHKNILGILNDNGIAIHIFPTLYSLPFLANYLVPEKVSTIFLDTLVSRDKYYKSKFPAYYRWCLGPTPGQIQKFNELGYSIIEYIGLFGHSIYYNRIKPLKKLHELKTKYLLNKPKALLTSYAYIVLKKNV